jgi:large repetitive protein
VITASDNNGIRFNATVQPGEEFSFTGSRKNELFVGSNVILTVNGSNNTTLTTSCNGIATGNRYGDFTAVTGVSLGGAPVCCAVAYKEKQPPVIINTPSDINASASPNTCGTSVTWTPPTVTDNCGLKTLSSSHQPGDFFPLGTTPVTYTATDSAGNVATSAFNVIVQDVTPPVISSLLPNISLNAGIACVSIAVWIAPTASDNCGSVTLTSTHSPGSTFPIGTTKVEYSATDAAGNISKMSFNVIVADLTPALISGCVGSDIVLDAGTTCEAVANWVPPIAVDLCPVNLLSNFLPGDSFRLGTTEVSYTADDGSSDPASCSFQVVVRDVTPPAFSNCVSEDVIVDAGSNCTGIASWTPPTAEDNCSVTVASNYSPGDEFPVGITQIIYTATDGSGNTATCSFRVVVRDLTPPVFANCEQDVIVNSENNCSATAFWTPPTATDNCSAIISGNYNPGDVFPIGTTAVIYTATDDAGNATTCSFNVIVKDTSSPEFTTCVTGDLVVSAENNCSAVVSWEAPIVSDNCAATVTSNYQSGGVFPVGITEVIYTAQDASGNAATCTFKVIVKDTLEPLFNNCITSQIIVHTNSCETQVTWIPPTATDNCEIVYQSNYQSGDLFPVGTTVVNYTATDLSGNHSTCAFEVVVQDVTAPSISNCPGEVIVVADDNCQASATWTVPEFTDNCDVTFTSNFQPGDFFPSGITEVVYTATDPAGNTTTCKFSVIVEDETAPIINCPSDITVVADSSGEAIVTWNEPVVSDCSKYQLSATHQSGDVFTKGTTAVQYTAADEYGLTSSCTFRITVEDKTAPIFSTTPNDIVARAKYGECEAVVFWDTPIATDNCGPVTITSSHQSGSAFPIGITTVKCTATDASGNVSAYQFDVHVQNESAVQFSGCPEDIVLITTDVNPVTVQWIEPTAEVPCGIATISATHHPGDSFSAGSTIVTYSANDNFETSASCSFQVVINIEEPEITASEIMTPDNDGINDTWSIENVEEYPENKVLIVDRWGSVIYTASGYNNETVVWTGLSQTGNLVPTGTYFYTVEVTRSNSTMQKRGFLELIR